MHARALSSFLLTCKQRLQVHALAGPDYLVLGYVLELLQVLGWSEGGGAAAVLVVTFRHFGSIDARNKITSW